MKIAKKEQQTGKNNSNRIQTTTTATSMEENAVKSQRQPTKPLLLCLEETISQRQQQQSLHHFIIIRNFSLFVLVNFEKFKQILSIDGIWLVIICHAIAIAMDLVALVKADGIELSAELFQKTNSTVTNLFNQFDRDSLWTTETLIEHYGYPVEVHRVVTEDGYILLLHRLPQPGHRPVLLVHGLYGSAMDFVLMGNNTSLAFMLWDNHYDVWLANCRGSTVSQNHTKLQNDDLKFWNFSFHDIGLHDLPALINYIRNDSSFHDIFYVGHSQGATALLILAAMRPEYCEKISFAQLLAPITTFQYTKMDKAYLEVIGGFLKQGASRNIREFMPRGFFKLMNCFKNRFLEFSCIQMVFQVVGPDMEQFNQAMISLILHQMPNGGSVKQLRHFFQIYNAREFRHYNYGFEGNYDKYTTPTPPPYNLSQVRIPIAIQFGANDYLAPPEDVALLGKQLSELVEIHKVPHDNFNHLDFIWAKDLAALVNRRIIETFSKKFKSEPQQTSN